MFRVVKRYPLPKNSAYSNLERSCTTHHVWITILVVITSVVVLGAVLLRQSWLYWQRFGCSERCEDRNTLYVERRPKHSVLDTSTIIINPDRQYLRRLKVEKLTGLNRLILLPRHRKLYNAVALTSVVVITVNFQFQINRLSFLPRRRKLYNATALTSGII